MPRIVEWSYPSSSATFFVKQVFSTVIHELWYVKSISEYAGARGTTAGKILQTTTSVLGMSQLILALLIWQYYSNSDQNSENFQSSSITLTRLILYCIGATACSVIGNCESAILWIYGRDEKIRTDWMNESDRSAAISLTQIELKKLESATMLTTEEQSAMPTKDELTAALDNAEKVIGVGNISQNYPVYPPECYYVYERYTKITKELSYGKPYLNIMVDEDEADKALYANIHMVSAIILIVCNTTAACLGWMNCFAKEVSIFFGLIGCGMFIVFSLMQYLSGNYDQELGLNDICGMDLTTQQNTNCFRKFMHYFRCAQNEVESYRCSKKIYGIIFIFVEFVGFGGVSAAIGVEAVLMYYYGLN